MAEGRVLACLLHVAADALVVALHGADGVNPFKTLATTPLGWRAAAELRSVCATVKI